MALLTGKDWTGVSWIVDITVGDDHLGLLTKKYHKSMCPILNFCGVVITSDLKQKVRIIENIQNSAVIGNNTRYI